MAQQVSAGDIDYRLGSGLRIPALGVTVGGYSTLRYDKLESAPGRLALGDLSLSFWWDGSSRFKVFGEFNGENSVSSRAARSDDEDRYLALERFYVDYAVDETTTLRIGKFLTPIGRWNLVHATPLVWTTSRPLATSLAFPTNVTGLMVSGSLEARGVPVDYMVYGSNGDEVRPNPALDTFHEAIGLRATTPLGANGSLGVSWVNFEQAHATEDRRQLFGVDFIWSRQRWEVSGEFVHRTRHVPVASEGGGFLQLVAPLTGRLYAVGRFEAYRQAPQPSPTILWVLGLSWRVTPAVVLKAEIVNARNNRIDAPEGFLSSISVLF